MDRKMFDISEFYNRTAPQRQMSDGLVENCFNTDVCVDSPKSDVSDVLTMAFVNMQQLDYVYNEAEAFSNGSLFPNITKPFYGGKIK